MNSNSYWILDELKKRKHDSQTAIIYRNSGISYAELWEKSENAAQWILSRSTTNVPIIIYGHKEIEVIILMIAALNWPCICSIRYYLSGSEGRRNCTGNPCRIPILLRRRRV